jgi:hypothetical protein
MFAEDLDHDVSARRSVLACIPRVLAARGLGRVPQVLADDEDSPLTAPTRLAHPARQRINVELNVESRQGSVERARRVEVTLEDRRPKES